MPKILQHGEKPKDKRYAICHLCGGVHQTTYPVGTKTLCAACERTVLNSPCTHCQHLEMCYQILWDIVPLPCQQENFAMPRSAGWVEVIG